MGGVLVGPCACIVMGARRGWRYAKRLGVFGSVHNLLEERHQRQARDDDGHPEVAIRGAGDAVREPWEGINQRVHLAHLRGRRQIAAGHGVKMIPVS